MNIQAKRNCGRLIEEQVLAPAQEVLEQQGSIFSCGGVYVGTQAQPLPRPKSFQFVHLTNHQKDVLVLNHQKVYRVSGRDESINGVTPGRVASPQETIRRLFKESLN